eukprot:Em0001g2421a
MARKFRLGRSRKNAERKSQQHKKSTCFVKKGRPTKKIGIQQLSTGIYLPPLWSNQSSMQFVHFCKMEHGSSNQTAATVTKSVTINEDLSWSVNVHGHKLIAGLLNMECSEEDIYTIAGYDLDWKVVGRRLIGEQKVMDIDREGSSENDKRDKMLLEWRKTKTRDATYQALVNVLRTIGNNATADRVEELKKNSRPQDIANLGIIIADQKEGLTGGEPVLSFVHLTNQEFLAAFHVSTLPPDEQLKTVREHVGQPHMGVVLKFFCGITGLHNPDHWTSILDNALIVENDIKKVNMKAVHCVFESQNGQRCRELFSKADGKLLIRNETLTLLDYCVVGYCLESAHDAVKSITLMCQLTAEGQEIIVQKLTRSIESVIELQ